jgi:hypothetical protein
VSLPAKKKNELTSSEGYCVPLIMTPFHWGFLKLWYKFRKARRKEHLLHVYIGYASHFFRVSPNCSHVDSQWLLLCKRNYPSTINYYVRTNQCHHLYKLPLSCVQMETCTGGTAYRGMLVIRDGQVESVVTVVVVGK